jgi:hypothetical protein
MSEHARRTLIGAPAGLVLLLLLMLAVTAGLSWAAYAVPVVLIVTLAWAFDYGTFGWKWSTVLPTSPGEFVASLFVIRTAS